ncbi:MAG TPA: DUF2461 domain-containing protein [Burkholderiales bacterium]|nr:DUF2461 domain-containing protein [Burkholderiales bacterium]
MADAAFAGFTKETIRFFIGLRRNNDRDWFATHREVYDKHVMEPAKAFVVAMGERLRTIAPRIVAVPLVNKSIFRLNRDTRFSLDPSPYKTNLGLYFWEGTRGRMECPGFYFHLEPPDIFLGGGMYIFSDSFIPRFRRAAVDPKFGGELRKIINDLAVVKGCELGGVHYKRVPAGYDPNHPNAGLLKHNGLYAGWEAKVPEELYSARLLDYCFERYAPILPLHRWLVKVAG